MQAQELRLSNTTIQENLPPETLVGQFYSDSFNPIHYLPGIHDIAISRDYLYYVADDGDLWVVKIATDGEAGPPAKLVENGVISVVAGKTKVYYTMEDGSLWELEIFLIDILNDPKLTSKKKKLIESNVYQAFPSSDGRIITMDLEGKLSLASQDQEFPLDGHSAISVACCDNRCVFVKKDGSLWGFVGNDNQQQKQPNSGSSFYRPVRLSQEEVREVAATNRKTYFIRADGSLWVISKDTKEFSSFEEPAAKIEPSGVTDLAAKGWYCAYLLEDGTAQLFATELKHQESHPPMNLGKLNAVLLTAGNNAFAYTKKDGSLWYQKVDQEKPALAWPNPVEIRHPQSIFQPFSTDNHLFRISGSQLLTRQKLEPNKKPYKIYVRSVDQQGRDVRKEFTIKATDNDSSDK